MDKYEERRKLLADLAESLGHGGLAAIAARINKAPSYVSRMLYMSGKPGRKRIGEDTWDVLVEKFPELSGSQPSMLLAIVTGQSQII